MYGASASVHSAGPVYSAVVVGISVFEKFRIFNIALYRSVLEYIVGIHGQVDMEVVGELLETAYFTF